MKATSARPGGDARSSQKPPPKARWACSGPSTTTWRASASRSGRGRRHALADTRRDAALESPHLPPVHRRLGDGAEVVLRRNDQDLVARADLRIGVADETREHVLPVPLERDRIRFDDHAEARRRERRAETPGAGRLEGEEAVLGPEGEDVLSVREDVADLAVVLRYDVGYEPPQEGVRGAEAELELGRGADPQGLPVGDPAARGARLEIFECGRSLPQNAEVEAGARGPLPEEHLRGLGGLDVGPLRDDRLGHGPHVVELDRDGTPEGFHDRVDIRLREHLREDRSEGLRERAAAFREDQQALRGRRSISFDRPPAEPMEDRPMGCFGSDVVQGASRGERLRLLEERVVLADVPQGAGRGGVRPRPTLHEFPEVALRDRPPDLADRGEADMQVVLREEGLVRGDVPDGMFGADRARATGLAEFRCAARSLREEHAAVASIFRVGRGVGQVASEEHREREHHRMPRSEEVDGLRRVQSLLRCDDDSDKIPKSIRLKEGDDAADRANGDAEGRHLARASLAEVRVQASLNRADERHVAPEGVRLFRPVDRLVDICEGPVPIVGGFGKDVEHRPQVRADRLLELDHLRIRHVDVSVDVRLEGAGIRHHGAGESQERVDSLPKGAVPTRALPEDVRVRDQDLRVEPFREIRGRNDRSVRVHHRQEGGSRHPAVTGLDRTDPSEPVAVADLEHVRPMGAFRFRLSRTFAPPSRTDMGRASGSGTADDPGDLRPHRRSGVPHGGTTLAVRDPHVGRFLLNATASPHRTAAREAHGGRDRTVSAGAALRPAMLLVTFNGSRFDLPFLRKAFPRFGLDLIHMDLLHPLRRLGFAGGLKSIEEEMGISRSDETTGLRGIDAIRLWHAYERGDDDALDLLLAYNMEDVVNLEPLAEFTYEALRSLCLDGGFVTADRYRSEGGP